MSVVVTMPARRPFSRTGRHPNQRPGAFGVVVRPHRDDVLVHDLGESHDGSRSADPMPSGRSRPAIAVAAAASHCGADAGFTNVPLQCRDNTPATCRCVIPEPCCL
jgi:hypothetical protein